MINETPKLSIILPCRNEEQALPICLSKIKEVIKKNRLNAEIIVSDSSTDKSPEIAKKEGVKLIKHNKEGYGTAYLEAFGQAKGKYFLMADCDGSYDFDDIPRFIKELKENDLVIGYRKDKSSLPYLNRIGNFFINKLLRLRGVNIKESCTGFIGARRNKLFSLNLKKPGMEFSSELLVKAKEKELKIKEIDINFEPRMGKSKLRRFRDGFKHLKYLLFKI